MAVVELQERDDWPESLIVAWLNAWQVSPLGSGLSDRVTVPLKPLTGFSAMVEVADDDPSATAVPEVAEIAKSGAETDVNVKVVLAVWVSELLVPVTVTV